MKWSLVKKISLYFAFIMLTVFCLLYFGLSGMMIKNNENEIAEDMKELSSNVSTYIDQAIALHSSDIQQNGLTGTLPDIVNEMNLMFGGNFGIYSSKGELIYTTEGEYNGRDDLNYAVEGLCSYTIDHTSNGTVVHFSFPAQIDRKNRIIRFEADYTSMYDNSQSITLMVLAGSAVILFGAFLMLIVMIVDVAAPIRTLSNAIRNTAINPEEITPIRLNRKDEIGRLASDYNYMASTIRSQMLTIESEKNNLNKTLEYRKSFFDNLTHELKTPLTIIIGYAEMMEQTDFDDSDFNKKGIHNIITESKRLRDMVTGLLDSSRETVIPEDEATVFDPSTIIDEVAAGMNIKAESVGKRIIVRNVHGEIKGSSNMIHQLLINLFDNAIKYGKAGCDILVSSIIEDNYYVISVSNPISPDHEIKDISKIFMPFYRSREDDKKEAGSVGLGLTICKSIAIAHHGNITAQEIDGNIVFTSYLPIHI